MRDGRADGGLHDQLTLLGGKPAGILPKATKTNVNKASAAQLSVSRRGDVTVWLRCSCCCCVQDSSSFSFPITLPDRERIAAMVTARRSIEYGGGSFPHRG
ncbi:hypothetical protein OJAV_G00060630 [Oryzias javanicus]|uniref:Uncharacterized protein n=1 Tax=Oryzias javanicus TaxID=123683 RepID=A0A3S2N2H4_ORYJA|nr:hypothetical protein OJAV_G00060630 [Oryzias javanicus]